MNWQRGTSNWVSRQAARGIGNPGLGQATVTAQPEMGTAAQGHRYWQHQGWNLRAYGFQKFGQHVKVPNWVAVEVFLPTEVPKFSISPFIRRAPGIPVRVLGRFKSASKQLNQSFDLFAEDPAADQFGRALLQPGVANWLLTDQRTRQANLGFMTILLEQGKDRVPFTQRHGVLIVEMPGTLEDQGKAAFLAELGVDYLSGLPRSLWQGQPPSGQAAH